MMEWSKLLSRTRFKISQNQEIETFTKISSQEESSTLRSDFHVDADRIIFCGSFRRLGRKTQVHPFARHDLTHNRLTHSVEVASVGRSIGNRVGVMLKDAGFLPENYTPSDIGSIVQTACFAHDMGNPPFGHAGEFALRDWFLQPNNHIYLEELSDAEKNDIQTYEGNAHSLRIVLSLEMYRNFGGMRLTSAGLGTLLKYPWTSSYSLAIQKGKFNIYQTELPIVRKVMEELGLIEIETDCWVRHPLSYLMEAADDICYGLMDLEDAVDIGIISTNEFERILSPMADVSETWTTNSKQQYCAMLRGIAIGNAINSVADTFMKHHYDLLNGTFQGKDLIGLTNDDVRNALIEAKKFASQNIYTHDEKVMTEIASFPCIASILSLLVPAAYAFIKNKPLNYSQKRVLESLLLNNPIDKQDSLYIAYMKILDYIGGMTDDAAARMAREVSGIGMM